MAYTTLSTDYVNDVLDTSVNTNRKYTMTENDDGTVSFTDVTEYSTEGDGYGATQINEQNEVINAINERIDEEHNRTMTQFTSLTDLASAAAAQNLEAYGLKIGDYYVGTSGYKYYIADMNTFYGNYDSYAVLSTPHIGLVVDTQTTGQWYTSNDTTVGYSGSTLHSTLTGTVLTNIISDLGSSHLLSHQKLLTTSNTAWSWSSGQYISALSEVQVYGSTIWSLNGYQEGECCRQLELFRKFRFNEVFGNISVWLRNIMSSSIACNADGNGFARYSSASASYRVAGLILFY